MPKALVSVLVVNFNRLSFLSECLESIHAQDYGPVELIVVDNGSTDGSRGMLESRPYPIKTVFLDRNTGFTGGNRAGLERATGTYIALVNNDAVLSRDWIRRHAQALDENPPAGFTASKIVRYGDPRTLDCAGDGMTTSGRGFKLKECHDPSDADQPRWVFGASAAAAMYRRSMIDDIGFLDPRFFFNHEDTDLSFRAQLAGWKCLYLPRPSVRHRVHGSYALLGAKANIYFSRNCEMVWLKNMPSKLLLRYLHHHLIHECGAFAKNVGRPDYLLEMVLGKLALLAQLPHVLRERRRIQGARRITPAELEAALTPFFGPAYLRRKDRAVGRALEGAGIPH
jgi:GT2 family glycosyltransferase